MTLLKIAKEYTKLGISVIATDANKRSLQQWTRYRGEIATEQELTEMFANPKAVGIATICGAVSGNIEVLDLDCKYDLTENLFQEFMQAVIDTSKELAESLCITKTKGGGYHIIYRCDQVEGNQKLAQRFTTDEERKINPHEKVKVLTETRGEGGYVIAVPTPGYKYVQNTARSLPVITASDRALLLNIARSFNTVIEEVHNHTYVENKSFNKSPFADYNERGDIIGLLRTHGWRVVKDTADKVTLLRPGDTTSKSSGDYSRKMGLFSVFTTSSEFEPNKGYRPAAVYAMLECNNDYKVAAKKLLAEGFGEPYKRIPKDVKKYIERGIEEGLGGEKLLVNVASKFSIGMDEAREVIKNIEQGEKIINDFWFWDSDKKKLSLSYTKFAHLLNSNGFGLYFYDHSGPIFKIVHNDLGRLEEASTERIKKFIQQYILDYPLEGVEYTREQLLEVVYRNNNIFSDKLYEYLGALDIDFLRDTKKCCYIPFKNGIAEIGKSEIKLLNHGQVNKVIWKTELINFDVDIDQADDSDCEFIDFLEKVTGSDKERMLSAISIIGYLLHKHKDQTKTFAIILAEETDDETKSGGTGKGVFVKALEKILSTVTIDGKNFKADKSFAYQRVKLDTKLVAIQDVDRMFDFEKFYSIITEGWTIEKKNKDELYINYADSPKVILTTNYTINDTGNHAKRRQRVIEFSDYFGVKKTPLDEYGHLLFNDWDRDEWNRFYNFMFYCVQYYLANGIKDIEQGEKYRAKKIKIQFGEEFLSWFTDHVENGFADEKKFTDLYTNFLAVNDMEKKEYSHKRFKRGLEVAAENMGFKISSRVSRQLGGKILIKMTKNT